MVSLRRSDEVELLRAKTLVLKGVKTPRTFLRAEFRKVGASTPDASAATTPGQMEGHCIVSVLHTRSGSVSTGFKINHDNPLQLKTTRTR